MLWGSVGVLVPTALALFAVQTLRGPRVPAVVAKQIPLTQQVVVSGRVTPPAEIQIGPNLSGTVRAVKVDEGDFVDPGAVLVELEAAELDAAVAQAEGGLRQASARLRQLLQVSAPMQAEQLRQAELSLDQARRLAERVTRLAEAGSISSADLDDATNRLAQAESRLASARAQAAATGRGGSEMGAAEAAVSQAEAQLAAARARRAHATLTSPVKAQVLRRDVEPGDAVSPGRVLITLGRVGTTRLTVEPDEKNLAYIQPGQRAVASADAFADQRFAAVVESISPAVNPERGTVEVKLTVAEPPPYLRPDMTVSVEIQVAEKDAAIVVPAEAIQEASGPKPWILKASNGRVERAEIRLGLRGVGRIEVLEGIGEGEVVLVPEPRAIPAPGDRVQPHTREP